MSLSPFPNDRKGMVRAGYTMQRKTMCRECGEPCEWWRTTKGKMLLFDPAQHPELASADDPHAAVLHATTCKRKAKEPVQQSLWQGTPAQRSEAAFRLAGACNARLVVVLQDDFTAYSYRQGITPEDLAHELITAANKIRRELGAQHAEA